MKMLPTSIDGVALASTGADRAFRAVGSWMKPSGHSQMEHSEDIGSIVTLEGLEGASSG